MISIIWVCESRTLPHINQSDQPHDYTPQHYSCSQVRQGNLVTDPKLFHIPRTMRGHLGVQIFFLREPADSPDDNNTASPITAFTYEQQLQLNAQAYVYGDLRLGKPPAEHTMVHAFGEPGIYRRVRNMCGRRYDTPPSSSLLGSCTSGSKDTTVCKTLFSEPRSSELHHISLQHDGSEEASQVLDVGSARSLPEKRTEVLKQENAEEAVITSEPKQRDGGEKASQVLDVGGARGLQEKQTEVLKQQNGEEAVINSEPRQHAGGEDAGKGEDVGSARSHPLVNITEHCCSLALHERCSKIRSSSKKKPDSCVKCGQEGELLKCCTCSLAAHGSCCGSYVRFDGSGLFYCHVCFFKKADEAYERAKITRSEAWKNLSAFFYSDLSVQPKENQFVKQGNHQSEAANLSRKDEGHEKRNDACPEAVVSETTPTFGLNPRDAKFHEVGNSSSSQEVPHSSQNRLSPIADRSIEADIENGLMNSSMTHSRRVRFHIKETVVSHSYGKARKRCYPQPPECH